ncbi:MAG: aldehyde dehydrogenase family protein [Flavobacteriales bacterium]|nr:aldehyde dehydrogenase family protein [Flavobacteriales bacterium]
MTNLKVYSPYDNSLIKELELQSESGVESYLAIAHQLHKKNPQGLPAYQRIEILEKTAKILSQKSDDLIKTAVLEGGKPYQDTKVEILRAINGVKLAAQSIGQLYGEEVPMGLTATSTNRMAFTTKEPIGVVVAISAFNHPINLIVHQVATAVAAGCPVIVKPALTTPLSCIAFVDILKQAGLPEGWAQVLICSDENAEKLATDKRVGYLTFIGSAKVGWYLRTKIANGTRCAMEHGGVAPVIVDKTTNIDELINPISKGAFYHAGQVCVSVQKVFVHRSLMAEFADKITEKAQSLIVGNPLNKNTEVGPIILNKELVRIEEWVNEAVNEGAKLLCGGKRISESCFEPTVLLNPNDNSKVSTQEIFGPVVCLYEYENVDKVIEKINSLRYAFQASIFTNDINFALSNAKNINASAVMINDHTAFRVDWMPFGGRDESGLGVGGILHTMREMTREKLIVFKSDGI